MDFRRLPSPDFLAERVIAALAVVSLLATVVFQIGVIFLRSFFDAGFVWLHDLVLASFGVTVVFSIALAFFRDRHVRVDVASRWLSAREARGRDLAGLFLLLLPFAAVIVWTGFPFVERAWSILEGARDVGGLPGVFVVKSLVVVLGMLLVVGGLALMRQRAKLL